MISLSCFACMKGLHRVVESAINSCSGIFHSNRNMSKSKGWTLQSSLLMLWMEKTRVNNQTKIDDNDNLLKTC